jgi:hypothetical protein
MKIFGFKVFMFKLTSLLFMVGHNVFFYYSFRGRARSTALVLALLLIPVSTELMYFSSQTYTEAMFLFLQSALFFVLIKYFHSIEDRLNLYREHWWKVLLAGFIIFLISITRNNGIIVLGVVLFYLLTEKKFFLAGFTFATFLPFRLLFSLYKSVVWHAEGEGMGEQLDSLFYKNFYNHALGKEDFGGFVNRFLENSETYLSRLLMIGAGLRDPSYSETSALVTILLYALFGIGIYFAIRKSSTMRLVGYYLGIMLFSTFLLLQTHWGQMRMVIIYLPLVYLFLPWGLFELAENKKIRWTQPLIVLLLFILFFKQFGSSVQQAQDHNEVLKRNMRGDRYYGYTPDWVNFLKMSEWAAENVPDDVRIGSRKPSMSFIYGDGRTFHPIYRFPTLPADTALKRLEAQAGNYTIISEQQLKASRPPAQFEYGMKQELRIFVTAGDTTYSVYNFLPEQEGPIREQLSVMGLNYETDLDFLRKKISDSGKPGVAVVPDSLVNLLLRGNVDYIIRGNLRLNPSQKTNRVINTIHRYMYYMNERYYGIFKQISRIGENENEPAYLFQIQWDRYDLKKPGGDK